MAIFKTTLSRPRMDTAKQDSRLRVPHMRYRVTNHICTTCCYCLLLRSRHLRAPLARRAPALRLPAFCAAASIFTLCPSPASLRRYGYRSDERPEPTDSACWRGGTSRDGWGSSASPNIRICRTGALPSYPSTPSAPAAPHHSLPVPFSLPLPLCCARAAPPSFSTPSLNTLPPRLAAHPTFRSLEHAALICTLASLSYMGRRQRWGRRGKGGGGLPPLPALPLWEGGRTSRAPPATSGSAPCLTLPLGTRAVGRKGNKTEADLSPVKEDIEANAARTGSEHLIAVCLLPARRLRLPLLDAISCASARSHATACGRCRDGTLALPLSPGFAACTARIRVIFT